MRQVVGSPSGFRPYIRQSGALVLCLGDEVAFIDDASDAAQLDSSTCRGYAATAYLHALQRHCGETPHNP